MGVDLDAIAVGAVVTRFGEVCTRVERRTYQDPVPDWFDPQHNKAHNAIHRGGVSTYFAVELDLAAREAAHPFETEIAANVTRIEQLSLHLQIGS